MKNKELVLTSHFRHLSRALTLSSMTNKPPADSTLPHAPAAPADAAQIRNHGPPLGQHRTALGFTRGRLSGATPRAAASLSRPRGHSAPSPATRLFGYFWAMVPGWHLKTAATRLRTFFNVFHPIA